MHPSLLTAVSKAAPIEIPARRGFLECKPKSKETSMSLTAVAVLNLVLAVAAIGALSAVVAWPFVSRRGETAQVAIAEPGEPQTLSRAA